MSTFSKITLLLCSSAGLGLIYVHYYGDVNSILLQTCIVLLTALLVSLIISKIHNRELGLIHQEISALNDGDLDILSSPEILKKYPELASSISQIATNLKTRIESVLNERNLLDAVLSSLDDCLIAVDQAGNILTINPPAQDLFGLQAPHLVGTNLNHSIGDNEFKSFLHTLLTSGKLIQEAELKVRNDSKRYIVGQGVPLRDLKGQQIGALIVLNDVTRLRRLEQIRHDFVANVSHELKTPITSIKGFAETLLDGALDSPEDAKRFVKIIAQQSERLHSIIEDLLSLAKIEEEKTSLQRSRQNVIAVIKAAIATSQLQRSSPEIKIVFDTNTDFATEVNAPLLEQAIVNLIDNSVKYGSPNHPITISISEVQEEIVISVIDRGPGIEPHHLERLFERFYRVDKGRSRASGGTGLGLSIVKHIVQAHGGYTTVQSTPGEGSCFSIHLPKGSNLEVVGAQN